MSKCTKCDSRACIYRTPGGACYLAETYPYAGVRVECNPKQHHIFTDPPIEGVVPVTCDVIFKANAAHSNRLVYLAGPYSSSSKEETEHRCVQHQLAAAYLMSLPVGLAVFSPIAHSMAILPHLVAQHGKEVDTWQLWARTDLTILSKCTEIIVLMLPGWLSSVGTRDEVTFARSKNIPVLLMHPDTKQVVPMLGFSNLERRFQNVAVS